MASTVAGTKTTTSALSSDAPSLWRTAAIADDGRRYALVLAAVLALDSADRSAVGVLAPNIEHAFHVSNTDIGVLAAAFGVVGGLATVPVGVLTDRGSRVRLLAGSVILWSAAMAVGGLAFSFAVLFAARLALGIGTATGGPTVLSLTGDLFNRRVRGRALSFIRAGEYIGAGLGFLVAGAAAALLSWRGVFLLFALVSAAIAFRVARLREPPRTDDTRGDEGERGIGAQWRTMRYALGIPSYRMIIVAGAVGDFFFAAIAVFGVVFAVHQYEVSQATAAMLLPVIGIGAFAGLVVSGRLTDTLIAKGISTARILVPAFSLMASVIVLASAAFPSSLTLGVPILFVGGVLLAAPIPALDAARLDVVRAHVWGRAESLRTLLRVAAQALGPLTFGLLSDQLAGGGTQGMRLAFLVLLIPLAISGLVLLKAKNTYCDDAATAGSVEDGENVAIESM